MNPALPARTRLSLALEFKRPTTGEVYELTLDLEPNSSPSRYVGVWSDVTTMKGKWDIKVKNGRSNIVTFKIDKRQQIVQLAQHWAGLNLTRDDVGCSCDSFTNSIYNRVGINGNAGQSCTLANWNTPSILVPDSGDGALLFLWYRSTDAGTGVGTPSHPGILAGGDRIDCNGATELAQSGAGPSSNARDRWCSNFAVAVGNWFWGGTLPTRTVVDPVTGGSLLATLDAE